MRNDAQYVRDTIDLVKQIETRFIELGGRVYRIREEKLWEASYNSFNEFLEVAHITKGNASMLASIYKHYVVEGGKPKEALAGISYSNLYEAIPLIEKEGVDTAVTKAETLTRDEIKEEVRESEHGVHEHIMGKDRWGKCEICNRFERI